MATKKYWKGLEELENSPEFVKARDNEFTEHVPVEDFLGNEKLGESSTSRRDFLKFLGFSVTAASLAACESPVNKAIPYVIKPEEITPGVANWYASSYFDGSDYAGILVKTREGRPIKIEGNPSSTVTMGAANARIQASVLSLYDSSRITEPYASKSPAKWSDVDKEIGHVLADLSASGGHIRILTSTIISPSIRAALGEFMAKYPGCRHVTYDAVSSSGMIKANESSFGKNYLPSYHFDKANIIVSIGADFLASWISPVEFAKQYSRGRKVSKEKAEMSKHYQIESLLSLTGANADVRVPVKVSQQGIAVVALYNEVARLTGGTSVQSASLEKGAEVVARAAKDLVAAKGKSLVVCGINDMATQVLVNGINTMLGNYGATIDNETACYLRQGDDTAFAELVKEMGEGKVNAILTYNVNPVYTAPASLNFADAYKKVTIKISFADRIDETAEWADYVCPDNHYLESWGDANPYKGKYSLQQPTISQLFAQPRHEGTRSFIDTMLKWSGSSDDSLTFIKKQWSDHMFPLQGAEMGFTGFWNKSLHDGILEVDFKAIPEKKEEKKDAKKEAKKEDKKKDIVVEEEKTTTPKMDAAAAAQAVVSAAKGGAWELQVYEKTILGNGNHANNPWLQEMPDPISKITWDNYVTMSPIDMKEKKYSLMARQDRGANMITVNAGGASVTLPVIPQPGQAQGTLGIALGYGRNRAGQLSVKTGVVGENAYPFVQVMNGTMQYMALDAQIVDTAEMREMAGTQVHHTMMGRELVRETTLEEYKKDPAAGNEKEMMKTNAGQVVDPIVVTLWDEHDRPGHHWGLTIDLGSCIGCGACSVSCTAENNVAVVGREMVMKTREMHWLRIDRYYASDMTKEKAVTEHVGAVDMYLQMENPSFENPKVLFQPVMCQHCLHAPCETVCPVLATNHTSEGLNAMTYNRCVGTRYCANNCPFKVRRFNWFNYNANDKFTGINPAQDDLGRMVLNPDVVVRSRGVMEKCSMCVQRVQAGKLEAKKAGRKIKDGEFTTACAQSCPTDAIIFGDINDHSSRIAETRKDERNYFMLEELNIQPTVSYMTKVRNCEPEAMEAGAEHAEHKEG